MIFLYETEEVTIFYSGTPKFDSVCIFIFPVCAETLVKPQRIKISKLWL